MPRVRFGRGLVISSMAAAAAVGSALAQPGVSDPSRGRELADSLCSNCHEIEPGSKETLETHPPNFFLIANRPGQTAEHLAASIILSPHPEMPKAALTTSEMRDIVSYIMSLRAKD
jgi:mono/diheme cytochrome c family protein